MFDPNVTSINCGSLDFFQGAVDFDDLAFLNLIMCMQESDQALAAKMQEIRQVNELKRELTSELNYLNRALARSHTKADGKGGEKYVYVEGGLEDPQDPDEGRFKCSDEQKEFEKDMEGRLGDAIVTKSHMERKEILPGHWQDVMVIDEQVRVTNEYLNEQWLYKRKEVEARIEELRGQIEELNTSSSILMIDLQRLMNKRNEATQLVSNIEAKSHQTAQAIIANMK
jgi:hypothetical protein